MLSPNYWIFLRKCTYNAAYITKNRNAHEEIAVKAFKKACMMRFQCLDCRKDVGEHTERDFHLGPVKR